MNSWRCIISCHVLTVSHADSPSRMPRNVFQGLSQKSYLLLALSGCRSFGLTLLPLPASDVFDRGRVLHCILFHVHSLPRKNTRHKQILLLSFLKLLVQSHKAGGILQHLDDRAGILILLINCNCCPSHVGEGTDVECSRRSPP